MAPLHRRGDSGGINYRCRADVGGRGCTAPLLIAAVTLLTAAQVDGVTNALTRGEFDFNDLGNRLSTSPSDRVLSTEGRGLTGVVPAARRPRSGHSDERLLRHVGTSMSQAAVLPL